MLYALSAIAGIVSLVCWILTIVRAFSKGDTLIGIFCLCPLVGLIMGFVKMQAWNHQKVMMAWAIAVLVNLVLNLVFGAGVAGNALGGG